MSTTVRVQLLRPVKVGKAIHKGGEIDVTDKVAALFESVGAARRLSVRTTPASEPADASAGTDQSGSVSASVKAAASAGKKKP